MTVTKTPTDTKEENPQLRFILSLYSERIPVFEESIIRSNAVVKMSQKFPHLKFPLLEGTRSSNMIGLSNTGDGLNLVNMDYHQSDA